MTGVTASTGGGAGHTLIGVAGGGVRGNCGGARCTALYLATRPSARGFNGFVRSVVFRVALLEVWKDVLSAFGGPERQRPVILFIEPLGASDLHRVRFCLTRIKIKLQ